MSVIDGLIWRTEQARVTGDVQTDMSGTVLPTHCPLPTIWVLAHQDSIFLVFICYISSTHCISEVRVPFLRSTALAIAQREPRQALADASIDPSSFTFDRSKVNSAKAQGNENAGRKGLMSHVQTAGRVCWPRKNYGCGQ